jgi:integrase
VTTGEDTDPAVIASGSRFGRVRVFRKTAATELDRAGLTARQIADQLGHSKVSMAQDRYLGRRASGTEAAGPSCRGCRR